MSDSNSINNESFGSDTLVDVSVSKSMISSNSAIGFGFEFITEIPVMENTTEAEQVNEINCFDQDFVDSATSTIVEFQSYDTMTTHQSNGKLLAIHSVVVSEPYRRKGIATKMLKEYLSQVQKKIMME